MLHFPSSRLSGATRIARRAVALLVAASALVAVPVGSASPAAAGEMRSIVFPVDGIVRYSDDFGDPRSGGRTHEGNDLMGTKLQRLLATTDGRVTYLKWANDGSLSGNMLTITDADGWQYRYIHLNNDTPGSDDGLNPREWAFPSTLSQGSRVVAGQLVGFLGDSGNAEGTPPHVHFEIRRPDGTALNPYESLRGAKRSGAARGRAVAANPVGGYYVLTGDGTVHAYDGAPHFGNAVFGGDVARGLAVMPDGKGYVLIDGKGNLYKYGSARVGAFADYWGPGLPYDIARAVAISPKGDGIAILDGWGGTHLFGNTPSKPNVYWVGWDIARSVTFTASGNGLYVLDGWGGLHVSGDAVDKKTQPYWVGWDIARGVLAAPTGTGYAVLDGWGGTHVDGSMPAATGAAWGPGGNWWGFALQNGRYITMSEEGTSRRW